MKQLYYLEIDSGHCGSALNEMFLSLPDERKARLVKYRHEIDRITGIYSDILVRCLICSNSGVKNSEIEIKAGPAGKPYLASCPRYEFNSSHTRNAVAAAISEEKVGVDIERIRDVDISVAGSVFSRKELDLLDAAADNRQQMFLDLWTKKEALLKCRGTGLSGDLALIDTTAVLSGEKFTTVRSGGYIISVCSMVKFDANDFKKITQEDLFTLWRDYAH